MGDYRTKRRYRQQKLERRGFYHRRRQGSRATLKPQQDQRQDKISSMQQIFSPENLIRTYHKLQQCAGHAPGADGISYYDLSRREVAQIMRDLSKELLSGRFDPSRARNVQIPKASGRGHRTLKLRSILYRVVAAALADALGPYFDQRFLACVHGFRHGRGTQTMLLELERIIVEQERFVVAQDDIRNAFDHLPIEYLLEILQQHVQDEKLLVIVEKVLRGHRAEHGAVGIDQGSALSPLMLNVALHHGLDVPFSQTAAHPPWLRYADNLVYLAKSVHEGTTAIQAAQDLLNPIGMSLKGDESPTDLQKGQRADIFGFQLHWDQNQINYDLTEESWDSLKESLSSIHTHSSSERASQAVRGWMNVCGPAFESKSETRILNRVLEVSADVGHRELPRSQLKRYFQSSRDRWVHRQQRAVYAPTPPKRNREEGNEPAPLATDRTGHLVMFEAELTQGPPSNDSAPF